MDNYDDRESDFNIVGESEEVIFQPNHQLMAKKELNSRDLKPFRVFFYERITDKKMLILNEREAYNLTKDSSFRQILKQIGCSDGSAYSAYIRNCGLKSGQRVKRSVAVDILNKANEAELNAARGHFDAPRDPNTTFDRSFPLDQRASFNPPQ